MEKTEVLEKLQDSAREIASLESWFRGFGVNRLAEYATVWRLVNFKVQEIVKSTSKEKVKKELDVFHYDLTMKMEYYRDERITALSELYGAAIDGLGKAEAVITDYLS